MHPHGGRLFVERLQRERLEQLAFLLLFFLDEGGVDPVREVVLLHLLVAPGLASDLDVPQLDLLVRILRVLEQTDVAAGHREPAVLRVQHGLDNLGAFLPVDVGGDLSGHVVEAPSGGDDHPGPLAGLELREALDAKEADAAVGVDLDLTWGHVVSVDFVVEGDQEEAVLGQLLELDIHGEREVVHHVLAFVGLHVLEIEEDV
mmetsp:Transcript_32709/g.79550  ORF Transcript_32709/g.79550 Transcript_32709/m.79550 type:complete len:203 (+) Transcript_32709:6486-7094(+)